MTGAIENTGQAIEAARGADAPATRPQAAAAAREFDAVFLAQMLKPMFEGLRTDGAFGGGFAEEIYRGLLMEHIGREMAATGGIGLAESVLAEMVKMQGEGS
jgi:Rod binding domain-containing protein